GNQADNTSRMVAVSGEFLKGLITLPAQVHLHTINQRVKIFLGYRKTLHNRYQRLHDGMRGMSLITGFQLMAPVLQIPPRLVDPAPVIDDIITVPAERVYGIHRFPFLSGKKNKGVV